MAVATTIFLKMIFLSVSGYDVTWKLGRAFRLCS